MIAGEVQRDQGDLRSGTLRVDRHSVLVQPRARFQLLFCLVRIDVHMTISAVIAAQAILGVIGPPDGAIALTKKHGSIPGHIFFVETDYFVGRVGAVKIQRLYAKMEAAEAHVHVGGPVIAIFLAQSGAGIDRETYTAFHIGFIRLDGHAAEWGCNADMVILLVCFPTYVAPCKQNKQDGQYGSANCNAGCERKYEHKYPLRKAFLRELS